MLTITASSGTVDFTTVDALATYGLTVVNGFDGTDGTLEVTGALSDINNALITGITYSPGLGDTLNSVTMSMDNGSGGTAFRVMSVDTTDPSTPVLQLTDTSGAIRNNEGTIDVAGDATLSNAIVYNGDGSGPGTVTVEANQKLTLAYAGIFGGTVNDDGTIEIAHKSTFNGATVIIGNDGQSGGEVVVDNGQTLQLKGGATLTGGEYLFGGGFAKAGPSDSVLLSGIGIADLDFNFSAPVMLTITASSGTVDFTTVDALATYGLTVVNGFDGTGGTLEVTGALSDINNALITGITYSPGLGDTLNSVTMSMDNGSGGTAFRVMSVDTTDPSTPVLQLTDTSGAIRNNEGTIDVAGDATLSNAIVYNGDGSGPGTVTIEANQKLTLAYAGIFGGTVNDDGTIEIAHKSTFNGATVIIGNDGQSGGEVVVDNGQTLQLKGGATLTGGAFNVAENANVTVSDDTTINSAIAIGASGRIEVQQGAALHLTGSLAGGGSIVLDAGSAGDLTLLELNATDSAGNTPTVQFNGGYAELQIDTSAFHGSIAGLTVTDEIDLGAIGYGLSTTATYTYNSNDNTGVLAVTDGSHTVDLTLIGDYSGAHFMGSDGGGHTLITLNAADTAPVISNAGTVTSGTIDEVADQTGVSTPDTASGTVTFTDVDLTDRPAVTAAFQSASFIDSHGDTVDISSLSSGLQADIAALELPLDCPHAGRQQSQQRLGHLDLQHRRQRARFPGAGRNADADLRGDGGRQCRRGLADRRAGHHGHAHRRQRRARHPARRGIGQLNRGRRQYHGHRPVHRARSRPQRHADLAGL